MDDRLKKTMAAVFGVDIAKIDENASAATVDEWDSLKHISLILALEEEFEVKFSNNEIMQMLDFSCLKEILGGKVKGRN